MIGQTALYDHKCSIHDMTFTVDKMDGCSLSTTAHHPKKTKVTQLQKDYLAVATRWSTPVIKLSA